MKLVTVNILVTNERQYLEGCIGAVANQTYPNIELIVTDNGSTDGSAELVQEKLPDVTLVRFGRNLGCSGGRNSAIRMSSGTYFMTLDPDVLLTPTFIEEKVKAAAKDGRIGMVEGKLLQAAFDGVGWKKTGLVDSTGVTIGKNRKNFDRGYGAPEEMYADEELVFGASGAAPLYRREMLDELKIGSEYFDEDFFIYREEVDLAWRAQLSGWKCIYTPKAVGYHIRTYSPDSRKQQPRTLRRLQFRNRYLMMLKNDTLRNILRHAPHILTFEILALGHALLREPHLLLGYADVLRLFTKMLHKRRIIQSRKSVPEDYVMKWFV
jgi:GT2 family glycosyltransferase